MTSRPTRGYTPDMNAVRHCGLMIVLLLLPTTCLAAPWGYELPIGDGYGIIVSTMGTVCAKGSRVVLDPGDYQGASSCIDQYATTRRHIFIRDYTAFFILSKGDDSVTGPLSGAEFEQHPIVLASGPLDWREPRHPHQYGTILLLLLINPFFVLPAAMVLLFVVAMLSLAYRRLRSANGPIKADNTDVA